MTNEIPVDNKVDEMTNQLWFKGGAYFKVIGECLHFSFNRDLAFSEGAEKMLADKELKAKKSKLTKLRQIGQKLKIQCTCVITR